MLVPVLLAITLGTFTLLSVLVPAGISLVGRSIGWHLRNKTQQRRELLISRTNLEKKKAERSTDAVPITLDGEWEKVDQSQNPIATLDSSHIKVEGSKEHRGYDGIVGFFHPFCNAGGGGERVLWAAIRATQLKHPNAICVVYTGDHDVSKDQMLKRAQDRFNISLYSPSIHFLYPTTRSYVLPQTWPHFTLLGQSLGSLVLAYDSLSLLAPDIFIDTMGYAFALALVKFLFPTVPVGAYVHYPTISTDMLSSLDAGQDSGRGGVHVGKGTGWRGFAKRVYWRMFASLYGWMGSWVDVVMTNSSWTQGHIESLWGEARRQRNPHAGPISVVFPPCAVGELEAEVSVNAESEHNRRPNCLYIAQFRAEKNHSLVLNAFARFLTEGKIPQPTTVSTSPTKASSEEAYDAQRHPHLTLIGSVRDTTDETYIYKLRLLAHELHITHAVTFLLNAPWDAVLSELKCASVGINAMWNEHFGIGVVEYQAAGLICVVNDSGGPKMDICRPLEEGRTGFHATTVDEYAAALRQALELSGDEAVKMRLRARRSARRFNEEAFESRWLEQMEELVRLRRRD